MIYLDNAATSFYKPQIVQDTVKDSLNKYTANPGRSGHDLSYMVAEKVFETREKLKQFFNAKEHEVIFTKNCTEALNMAILGFLRPGDHVITTCYEHNSVLRPLQFLKSNGVEVTILDCDLDKVAQLIEQEIKHNTKLIITTCVSNVTGDCCDIKSVGQICKKHKITYLVDGAQSSGHMQIDLQKCDVDMYAFAGHKGLLSITGVGGLLVKNDIKLSPIMFGGTGTDSINLVQPTEYPEGFESGTIATIPILSLSAGLDFLIKNFDKIQKKEEKLTKYCYFALKKLDFLKIYSKENAKNVITFNIKNINSSTVANMLNENFKICVRAGLHCAPLVHKKLGTQQTGSVRVSLDFMNTEKDIQALVNALVTINQQNS
ncbi:MAG: aminotransferase class V-fold PLP-dependent enzyme [Clostridia bacterium]|nr:aminotransferase class V-fold PLP-dependent enzyme [Clostridia bacterium]